MRLSNILLQDVENSRPYPDNNNHLVTSAKIKMCLFAATIITLVTSKLREDTTNHFFCHLYIYLHCAKAVSIKFSYEYLMFVAHKLRANGWLEFPSTVFARVCFALQSLTRDSDTFLAVPVSSRG